MQTAPPPVLSSIHQIGSQSIAFHIPADDMEMVIALNRKLFETPLIEMTSVKTLADTSLWLMVRSEWNAADWPAGVLSAAVSEQCCLPGRLLCGALFDV